MSDTIDRVRGIVFLKTPIIAYHDENHHQYFQVYSAYWMSDGKGFRAARTNARNPHFTVNQDDIMAFQECELLDDMIEGTFQADI